MDGQYPASLWGLGNAGLKGWKDKFHAFNPIDQAIQLFGRQKCSDIAFVIDAREGCGG